MHNSCAKRLFMTIATKDSVNPAPAVRVRWWLLVLGVIPLIGTALLAGRLIWEQTVWTWERGPQMVGFSLAHGSSAVLLFAPFFAWLLGNNCARGDCHKSCQEKKD